MEWSWKHNGKVEFYLIKRIQNSNNLSIKIRSMTGVTDPNL